MNLSMTTGTNEEDEMEEEGVAEVAQVLRVVLQDCVGKCINFCYPFSSMSSEPIRMRCYYTFIECVFIYHLCTLFGHISKTCRNSINDVISTASFLADCEVPSLCEVFNRVFKNRCLRMYATDMSQYQPQLHYHQGDTVISNVGQSYGDNALEHNV